MNRVGREQAGVWFWTFTWIVNLVMLNMLLAIIMDVYTEVKGSIGADAETLFSQTCEILFRWKQVRAGKAISLQNVLETLVPNSLEIRDFDTVVGASVVQPEVASDENLTVEMFRKVMPSLPKSQALRILVAAQEYHEQESRPPESLTEATLHIQRIGLRVEQLHACMANLVHLCEMSSSLVASAAESEQARKTPHWDETRSETSKRGPSDDIAARLEHVLRLFSDKLLRKHAELCDRVQPMGAQFSRKDDCFVTPQEDLGLGIDLPCAVSDTEPFG